MERCGRNYTRETLRCTEGVKKLKYLMEGNGGQDGENENSQKMHLS